MLTADGNNQPSLWTVFPIVDPTDRFSKFQAFLKEASLFVISCIKFFISLVSSRVIGRIMTSEPVIIAK